MDFTTAAALDEGLEIDDRADDARKDFFVVKDGECFAGTHLLIDVRDAEGLDDIKLIERAMKKCVEAAGATLLTIDLHHFTPNGGVSGVAILAESHISIHSWPEYGYAALDVFMCGDAQPHKAVPVLKRAFNAGRVDVQEVRRGMGMVA
ncbi:adenosylmethionine decarboxylase [Minwuia sp.]|uniref:adenosylmethionine decarboxylase n=1 Tax=Minwuia sp. TaxID=2493630 RepID=UPI003A8E2076